MRTLLDCTITTAIMHPYLYFRFRCIFKTFIQPYCPVTPVVGMVIVHYLFARIMLKHLQIIHYLSIDSRFFFNWQQVHVLLR